MRDALLALSPLLLTTLTSTLTLSHLSLHSDTPLRTSTISHSPPVAQETVAKRPYEFIALPYEMYAERSVKSVLSVVSCKTGNSDSGDNPEVEEVETDDDSDCFEGAIARERRPSQSDTLKAFVKDDQVSSLSTYENHEMEVDGCHGLSLFWLSSCRC